MRTNSRPAPRDPKALRGGLELALCALRLALLQVRTCEKDACAGPVVWRIGVTPQVRGSPKTPDGLSAITLGKNHLGSSRGDVVVSLR